MLPTGSGVTVVRYRPDSHTTEIVLGTICIDNECYGGHQQDCGASKVDDVSPFDTDRVIYEGVSPFCIDPAWNMSCDRFSKITGDTVNYEGCRLSVMGPCHSLNIAFARFDPLDAHRCYVASPWSYPLMLVHTSIDTCNPDDLNEAIDVPSGAIAQLFVDPVHRNTLWLTVGDSLFRSSNTGSSWSLSIQDSVCGMACSASGGMWYAVGPRGIFRSADSGVTFVRVDTSSSQCVTLDTITNAVYVGAGNSVLRSTDGGLHFTPYNNAFSKYPVVSIVANVTTNILAATEEGLFEISGEEVGVARDALPQPESVVTAFPNPFEGTTRITLRYGATMPSLVSHVAVVDPLGRIVQILTPRTESSGECVELSGESLATGIYFVRWIEGNTAHHLAVAHLPK